MKHIDIAGFIWFGLSLTVNANQCLQIFWLTNSRMCFLLRCRCSQLWCTLYLQVPSQRQHQLLYVLEDTPSKCILVCDMSGSVATIWYIKYLPHSLNQCFSLCDVAPQFVSLKLIKPVIFMTRRVHSWPLKTILVYPANSEQCVSEAI